jgi:hypothetical protein
MMSQIDSRHWTISTGRHFQNGCHNTEKIQHCPISSKFDMWVDNDFRCQESIQDVEIEQCWICEVLWWPFWKWRPLEIFRCRESMRDIIIYPHIKFLWYRTMLNFYPPFFMPCKGGQSHILRGSKRVGVTIESYGKVEISYINVDNF